MRKFINIVEGSILKEARRTTEAEFLQQVRSKLGPKAAKMTWPEIKDFAQSIDVTVPGEIRHDHGKQYKIDTYHWNLSGTSGEDVDKQVSQDLGVDVEKPEIKPDDPEYEKLMRLGKAKEISRLAATGKLYLFGRKPKGAFFRVPGLDEITAMLERMLVREVEQFGDSTMESQYEELREKVQLVAGGETSFIKSLLITGAPSSGKTFLVMKTIKEMGLKEGEDYIVKKGRITVLSMYRTLIEQLNGLTIFDDCDSVVEDKNGINMLKGALDTDPVREISYDVRGTINIAALPTDDRTEYADHLSRVMRYKETPEDVQYFREMLERLRLLSKALKGMKRGKGGSSDDEGMDDEGDEDMSFSDDDLQEQDLILQFVRMHLPNKIDYKGRIIFISNMDEGEWDSAILSRAMFQNMNFRDDEMLEYIDKIKGHIPAGISDEQKQEVMDYIREIYKTGKLKRPVNFRLVQMAFDYRKTPMWKQMIAR